LGFFGGENHTAHHIYIADGLECGVRVNADFAGNGFSSSGTISIHDITIQHCACVSGTRGNQGDFWGNMQGALNIGSGGNYDVQNIAFERIFISESRSHAIYIPKMSNNKQVRNITLNDISVNGAVYNGIYFYNSAKGDISYCNLRFQNVKKDMNSIPSSLSWQQMPECITSLSAISFTPTSQPDKMLINQQLLIHVDGTYYDTLGHRHE